MKTSSDALFRLIQSMTKGEKAYFKKYTTSNKSKSATNYFKLFEAIAKMLEYDEEVLLKKFRKESFVKNFVETKQYLKKQILRVLRNYSLGKSIRFRLIEDLQDIEILIKKGIYDLAKTRIKKALKIAQKYELIEYVFELNQFQLDIARTLLDYKFMESYIKEVIPEERKELKKIGNIQHYFHNYVTYYYNAEKYGLLQNEVFEEDFEQYPLDSFEATSFYYMLELNNGQLTNRGESFYKKAAKYYSLFKEHPNQMELRPSHYIACTVFYALGSSWTNRIEEGLEVMEEGRSFLEKMHQKHKISTYLFLRYYKASQNCQSNLYLNYGSKASYKEYYLFLKKDILKYWDSQSFRDFITDLVVLFICEVILEEWEVAEATYQQVMNYKLRGHRVDLDLYVRLMGIIVFYERENIELLDVSIDAAYQFIRGKDIVFKFPRQFVNFFKHKIIKAPNDKERIEHFKVFKTKTLAFFEANPEERNILKLFNFIAWMDSKIEGISIYEAYNK